jgi:transposase
MTTFDTRPFADDGKTAVHGLRRALAEVLADVGADADQPQEISRQFGLDKTLAWRISRVVREEDVWEAVQHIPRRPSIRIFVNAMTKHGATPERVETVWQALGEFERFVEVHSGDRETLEMMVSAAAKRSAGKRLENFRKSGFQANSAIWGVQARTQISAHLIAPSAISPDALSMSTVCGLTEFRRLRPDVPWAMATLQQWDLGEVTGWRPISPIAPSVAEGDPMPLMAEFCTTPLPEIRILKEREDLIRFMLAEGPVGNTAATTMVFGYNFPASASRYESYPGEYGEHGVILSTPVESVLHDLFVHRSLSFAFNPTAHVYSQLPNGPRYPHVGGNAGVLPVPDEVVDLGAGPPDTTTPEIPRYREMIEQAVRQMGHELNDFQGYRFRVRYPPIPTLAVLRHPLLRR